MTLKLIGIEPVTSWSWWWVTMPLWGGVVLFIGVMLLIIVGALVLRWIDK